MERKIVQVVKKSPLREINEANQNIEFWLAQTPVQRMEAVTFLSMQTISPAQKINKKIVRKFKIH